MVHPVQIADAFLETFDGGAAELLRAWLAKRPATARWMIGADFALRDKSRPNDCFAFTIIPYDMDFRSYQALIAKDLPRDLKDSRTLQPAAAALLKDGHAFHILVPIDKDRVLFAGNSETELEVARRCLRQALDDAVALERGPDAVLKARMAVQKSRAKASTSAY